MRAYSLLRVAYLTNKAASSMLEMKIGVKQWIGYQWKTVAATI